MSEPETIIERLRGNSSMWSPIMREAADEIERLRAALAVMIAVSRNPHEQDAADIARDDISVTKYDADVGDDGICKMTK